MAILIHKHAFLIQFWQDMLKLKCPPHGEENWHRIVEEIVKFRIEVAKTKFEMVKYAEFRIKLFRDLENIKDVHSVLTNIFMNEAATAVDDLVLKVSIHSMHYCVNLCFN